MTAEAFYKVLGPGREAIHGGTGVWPVPGEWLRVRGDLIPCRNGLHVCRARDLLVWFQEGAWVWRVEVDDRFKRVAQDDKVVVRRARLTEPVGVLTPRVLRLFAASCAESVAHLHGHHPACMDAIRVTRLFAHGLASDAQRAAARVAAWAAAGSAAGDAAWSAAWSAAGAAAGSAAWAAAGAAAWAAAWATHGGLLIDTLTRYGQTGVAR